MNYQTRRYVQVPLHFLYYILYHLSINHIKLSPTNVTNFYFTLVNHLFWCILFFWHHIYPFLSSTIWIYPDLILDIYYLIKDTLWQKVEDASTSNYNTLKIAELEYHVVALPPNFSGSKRSDTLKLLLGQWLFRSILLMGWILWGNNFDREVSIIITW